MAATHLDVGLRCIKYLLCAVNALFVLTGIMVITIGTSIYAANENYLDTVDLRYLHPATVLIVAGILVFVIAFLGCCGALDESTCMVLVFAVSLSIVLVLEIAAAIAAYALQDDIQRTISEHFYDSLKNYKKHDIVKYTVDFIQSRLHCCGYYGYEDWVDIMDKNNIGFPKSCCPPQHITGNFTAIPPDSPIYCNPYKDGCSKYISTLVHRSALYIGTGAMAIALIQLTGIMFACMLGKAIRRQKTERERRRWELRENLVNGYQPLGKADPFTTFPVVYMTSPEPTKNV